MQDVILHALTAFGEPLVAEFAWRLTRDRITFGLAVMPERQRRYSGDDR